MNDKVVIITGSTSGIGKATALAFAKRGAKVVISGRREEEGIQVVNEIHSIGAEAIFIKTDVTSEDSAKALVFQTLETFGHLDYAFNNAGFMPPQATISEQSLIGFKDVFNVNVYGVFLSMKYEIPAMVKNGGGAIVNNSSVAGIIGMTGMCSYVASKHAVIGLTRSSALEWVQYGVRINAVCPAVIQTDLYDRFVSDNESARDYLLSLHPIGRIGQPPEVAEAVVWLCSDQASFVIGHAMIVDGGFTVF